MGRGTGEPQAKYSNDDIAEMMRIVEKNASRSGDGRLNLPATVWQELSDALNECRVEGGPKTKGSVKAKFGTIKQDYEAVEFLRRASGISWDDEKGANIVTSDQMAVWEGIIEKRPDCASFKTKGWKHWDVVSAVFQPQPRGTNVFHAGRVRGARITSFSGEYTQPEASQAFDDDEEKSSGSDEDTPSLHPLLEKNTPSTGPTELGNMPNTTSAPSTDASTAKKRSRAPTLAVPPPSAKKGCPSTAAIMGNLDTRLDALDGYLAVATGQARPGGLEATPQRKARAIKKLHEVEDLPALDRVLLIKFFTEKPAQVDTYLALDDEETRQAWIARKVRQLQAQDVE